MNQNAHCRQDLDAIFSGLEQEFGKVSREISEYDKDLETQVARITQSTKQRSANGELRKDHPLLAIYDDIRTHIEQDCEAWLQDLKKNHMNREFRDKFNESMLVYVYGKVKSAKSSLGNFLAYGKHDPTREDVKAQPDIEFDVEQVSDASGEDSVKLEKQRAATRNDRKFLVDFFEATACIQYFKKPGFTWIDSPGIHSTTSKNENLAKDYLDCADLVVYTMSSRSTARETDREEIRQIIRSGKKLLLLVTRCDEIITDVDDQTGELVKICKILSPEERKEIRDGSISAIIEDLGEDAPANIREELEKNTVTLSVRYAEEHPEESGWAESGLPEFYSVLGNIARSDGVRLKIQAPLRAILHHIREMEKNVETLKKRQGDFSDQLAKVCSVLNHQTEALILNTGRELDHEIMTLAREYTGNDESFRQYVSAAAKKVLENASEQLAKTVAENTIKLTANLQMQDMATDNLPAYQDICQTITYPTTAKKRGGTLLGAIAGGAIGFALGSLPGLAIGVGLGSTGGGAVGSALDGSKSEQIKVGDNSLDVGRAAAQSAKEWIEKSLRTVSKHIAEACLDPLQEWLNKTLADLEEFENFLCTKKLSLEKEVKA